MIASVDGRCTSLVLLQVEAPTYAQQASTRPLLKMERDLFDAAQQTTLWHVYVQLAVAVELSRRSLAPVAAAAAWERPTVSS